MAYDDALGERIRDRLRDTDNTETALARPGVREFDFTGRAMRGWVYVAGDERDDDALDYWIEEASAFVETLPPK